MTDYSNQSDFLVSVDKLGLFGTLAAIEVSGTTTPIFDGGALEPYLLGSRATAKEFELSRPFNRTREMPIYKRYLPQINRVRLAVMIYPTDANLKRQGAYFKGLALLTAMMLPAVDAGAQASPAAPMLTIRMQAPNWNVS